MTALPIPPVLDPHGRTSYRICRRCVMDTTDPELTFGEDGVCHRCRTYDQVIAQYVHAPEEGKRLLDGIAAQIKSAGAGKRYDCIIGLSGGVDSTYVAMLVKDLGLRPLAIHVDNGWNTEAAVRNIENVVKKLGIDLFTIVIDWEEFRDLQKAFLFSSTPDSEIPSDHAIVSALYHAAVRENVRYIILGSNFQTEQMVPRTWSTGHGDWKYINTINERFGGRRLKTFPHNTLFHRKWWYPKVKKIEMILILNYVEYDKRKAMEKIRERIGWVEYGDKHHESIYTRFYQTYILPKKFGVDKRRPHLSSLINNSEMSRDEGLSILQKPPLDEEQLEQDRRFVIKKLGLSEAEFERIMTDPPKSFWQYPNYENSPPLYDRALTRVVQWPGKVRALPRRMLSLAYRLALRPYRLVKRMLGRG
jgi:N-acetyl sugar amidotransferase